MRGELLAAHVVIPVENEVTAGPSTLRRIPLLRGSRLICQSALPHELRMPCSQTEPEIRSGNGPRVGAPLLAG